MDDISDVYSSTEADDVSDVYSTEDDVSEVLSAEDDISDEESTEDLKSEDDNSDEEEDEKSEDGNSDEEAKGDNGSSGGPGPTPTASPTCVECDDVDPNKKSDTYAEATSLDTLLDVESDGDSRDDSLLPASTDDSSGAES